MSVEPGYLEHLATNRYFDRTFDCDAVKVLPGEYFVTTSDILLVTVLGSCVTACIRDRDKGLGGMNHFMLPGHDANDITSVSARYGGFAMEMLINQILKLGGQLQHPLVISRNNLFELRGIHRCQRWHLSLHTYRMAC